MSRLQPPPPQTRRADFRHRAFLAASRHGLCDLTTGSAFRLRPRRPRRTPPRPAAPGLHHDVEPPLQVLQPDGRRYHGVPAFRCRRHREPVGPLRSTGITPLHRYYGPIRHPLASTHFPGSLVIEWTWLRRFRGGARRASPVARRVLVTVPSLSPRRSVRRIGQVRRTMRPSPLNREARPPDLWYFGATCAFTFVTARGLTHHPSDGFVGGLQSLGFPPPCHPSYGALALTPAGLTPAEHVSFLWTHG